MPTAVQRGSQLTSQRPSIGTPCTPLATWQGVGSRRGRGHVPTLRSDRCTCTVTAHVGAPLTSEGFTEPLPRLWRWGKRRSRLCALAGQSALWPKGMNAHFVGLRQRPRNGAYKRPRWGTVKKRNALDGASVNALDGVTQERPCRACNALHGAMLNKRPCETRDMCAHRAN